MATTAQHPPIITEADTCRELITPKLQAAGWDTAPHTIGEQHSFTDGRIIATGGKVRRGAQKRADYLLYYRRDFPLAVVEAKAASLPAENGVQQAREYADILGLTFAYATNGTRIIEIDLAQGTERALDHYPSPDELFTRLTGVQGLAADATAPWLAPFNLDAGKPPRYYQRIAIQRVIEAILRGQTRILATLATGTGKTNIAFQVCWKLWTTRWNRTGEYRRPKMLFLADRNLLVDDPMANMFAPFGEARHKIAAGDASQSREMLFGIYQALTNPASDVFRQYPPDFFDLIIIDECHRGSSRDESAWRVVLDYFAPAVQVGMTATPLREESRDSYEYFGNPVYTYSLRQGIEDGFLAPYRVHRVITDVDAAGWRPDQHEADRYGRTIPDGEYHTLDFERTIALRARTHAFARHLTAFLKATDRFAKTLIFCVDQEHASSMREALINQNSDLALQYPDYVCRVTADEGEIGLTHLADFQDVDRTTPVILTTSQLLSTGVDAEMVKNVVLARVIGSRTEFKQIIGRGTRLKVDYGKEFFNIIDFTGTATAHFADPEFDGEPVRIEEVEIDETGTRIDETVSGEPPQNLPESPDTGSEILGDPPTEPRKYYIDGGNVEVIGHLVYDLDADGKKLSVVRYTEYSGRTVRTHYPTRQVLQMKWAHPQTRSEVMRTLQQHGISFEALAAACAKPDADPFDLLCHLAWNTPLLTRRQRAEAARQRTRDVFARYSATAREILSLLLERYVEHGISQFDPVSELLKVQPFDAYGPPSEIAARHFGDISVLREAIVQLQSALYQ